MDVLQVEDGSGKAHKIGILRSPVLKDLLLILLSHPTDFTVKCATQLLKVNYENSIDKKQML